MKKSFVNSKNLKFQPIPQPEMEVCESFIETFNEFIYNNKERSIFRLNTVFSPIPFLTDTNFKYLVEVANKEGWFLTRDSDNYQSMTYTMELNKFKK